MSGKIENGISYGEREASSYLAVVRKVFWDKRDEVLDNYSKKFMSCWRSLKK